MKKGILALSVIAVASFSLSAHAAEMMRYEHGYYHSGKTEVPFETQKAQERKAQSRKVSTELKNRDTHPIYKPEGLLRDRD